MYSGSPLSHTVYIAIIAILIVTSTLMHVALAFRRDGIDKAISAALLRRKTRTTLCSLFGVDVVPGVSLKSDEGAIKADFIQVNEKGIFVIDCKWCLGNVTGDAEDETWDVKGKKTVLSSISNPILQNQIRVKALESFLEGKGVTKTKVYGVVVVVAKSISVSNLCGLEEGVIFLDNPNKLAGLKNLPAELSAAEIEQLNTTIKG